MPHQRTNVTPALPSAQRSHKPHRAVLASGRIPPARPPTCNRPGEVNDCGARSWPAGSSWRSQEWPLRQRPPRPRTATTRALRPPPRPRSTTAATTTADAADSAQAIARWERRQAALAAPHPAYRADTRHWLTVIRGRPPAASSRSLASSLLARAARAARTALAASRASPRGGTRSHPPELRAGTASTTTRAAGRTPDAPYWGGLQMDYSFQADVRRLAPEAQGDGGSLERRSRRSGPACEPGASAGSRPWPNTAHYCGV